MFGYILIVLTLTLICAFFIWSFVSIKSSVVKQTGIVVSKDKIAMNSSVNSSIEKIYFKEGDKVSTDDVIMSLDSSEVDSNLLQAKQLKELYELRETNFNRLITYITNDYTLTEEGNSFDSTNSNEQEFYNYMSQYLITYNSYPITETKSTYKSQTINTYISSRDDAKLKKEQYTAQYDSYLKIKDKYIIKAPLDGYLHFNYNFNEGYFISAGTELLSISPSDQEYLCDVYFTAADISKIEVGNKVNGAVSGVSQNEYGTFKGKLISLASDSTSTENGQYFLGIVKFDENSINSSKRELKLKSGLQIEISIIYEETTYFNYFLEQIGIKIK